MSNIGNKETMANNLLFYVQRSGKSQREIAEAVGVARSTFTEWIKGNKYPRIDKIEQLANYFGILKSDLIEEKKIGDIPEEAEFHARILMDHEVMGMLEKYYALTRREQEIVRNFVSSLNSEG